MKTTELAQTCLQKGNRVKIGEEPFFDIQLNEKETKTHQSTFVQFKLLNVNVQCTC